MKKFYRGVIKGRKIIIVIFAAASLLCLFLRNGVAVNYDMNDYLPKSCLLYTSRCV